MRERKKMRSSVVEGGGSKRDGHGGRGIVHPYPWNYCEPLGTNTYARYPTTRTRPLLAV